MKAAPAVDFGSVLRFALRDGAGPARVCLVRPHDRPDHWWTIAANRRAVLAVLHSDPVPAIRPTPYAEFEPTPELAAEAEGMGLRRWGAGLDKLHLTYDEPSFSLAPYHAEPTPAGLRVSTLAMGVMQGLAAERLVSTPRIDVSAEHLAASLAMVAGPGLTVYPSRLDAEDGNAHSALVLARLRAGRFVVVLGAQLPIG